MTEQQEKTIKTGRPDDRQARDWKRKQTDSRKEVEVKRLYKGLGFTDVLTDDWAVRFDESTFVDLPSPPVVCVPGSVTRRKGGGVFSGKGGGDATLGKGLSDEISGQGPLKELTTVQVACLLLKGAASATSRTSASLLSKLGRGREEREGAGGSSRSQHATTSSTPGEDTSEQGGSTLSGTGPLS